MAKKLDEKYQEGFIKGKKVFLFGALPVMFLLLVVVGSALAITNFVNKMTVNKDNDVCNTVRRAYAGSVSSAWPCDVTEKEDYLLVTFDQSANTGQAPVLMSFKYDKTTKAVSPAISVN